MRTRFKLIVHESTGQNYEDLFVKIMSYVDPDFKAVKAHGNIGDRGNDGWNSEHGRYYQAYAPEELPKNNDTAIKKLKSDFQKLKSYWDSISPVREFYFVVNDKFKGVSPHVTKALSEIKDENNLVNVRVFDSRDLEKALFSLDERLIKDIVGSPQQNSDNFYQYIVQETTRRLNLIDWMRMSDNLIANSIEDDLIDSFCSYGCLVSRTTFPGEYPKLDAAIIELSNRVESLVQHFTNSEFAYLNEQSLWWQRDRRWKGTLPHDEYEKKYELSENWTMQLLRLHSNLVHALNLYAKEVRKSVVSDYFMHQSFVVNDSMGVYNNLVGYEFTPSEFGEIN
ncbi:MULTISPECIES: hypothetical protein [Vibrio]|uniref:hypothetical protein n=1 Tax=Vibrio TaxID=662 RepID=UPI001ABEF5E8|nr:MULTISPECIES: hypothetical protein [Vibrio]